MTTEPVFFYGTQKHKNGKHVLSQFYPCKFTDKDGYSYNCAEQYMMAHKALYFIGYDRYNEVVLDKIMEATDQVTMKKLGRQIRGFNDEEWNEVKEDIVYQGNYYKFSQNPNLKKILLNTGDRELFEASPYDQIWGIGVDEATAKATKRTQFGRTYWKGESLLGKALMKVRTELRKENC